MNVLGINGSPRPNGNTFAVVQAVLGGAAEAGAQTEMMQVGRWVVAGCRACRQCKDSHRCVVGDDMQRFYDAAPLADLLVIGSPIYLDHITAQLMAFIQRLFCYIGQPPAMESHYPRPGARAVLAITYGVGGEHAYDEVIDWLAERLSGYWLIPTLARFRLAAMSHDYPVSPTGPQVRSAYEFGRSLVGGKH